MQEENNHKKETELSLPMAIVLGAFIIAIALIVIKMPRTITTTTSDKKTSLDSQTITAMVNHIIATKNKVPVVPVSASDHIIGTMNPKLTLIEYSDLECPYCKSFDGTMNKVIQNYGNQVDWVYRHFPLDCVDNTATDCVPLHSKARHEAVASECAYEQGGNDAFWKYITKVFSITPSNNQLDPKQLITIAGEAGLNLNEFNTCVSSDKYADIVSKDAKAGLKSNVVGTPNTIIVDRLGNTYTIEGGYPYEVVSSTLDTLLKN
ncbi:MAG: DsbA family protein [bacterium]